MCNDETPPRRGRAVCHRRFSGDTPVVTAKIRASRPGRIVFFRSPRRFLAIFYACKRALIDAATTITECIPMLQQHYSLNRWGCRLETRPIASTVSRDTCTFLQRDGFVRRNYIPHFRGLFSSRAPRFFFSTKENPFLSPGSLKTLRNSMKISRARTREAQNPREDRFFYARGNHLSRSHPNFQQRHSSIFRVAFFIRPRRMCHCHVADPG